MSLPAEKARIGQYEIISQLDAPDRELYYAVHGQRRVILALFDLPPEARQRLHEEALRCKELEHPAVVPVIDSFESGGQQVLVYEAIEGVSLLRLLEDLQELGEALTDAAVLLMGEALMGALATAHNSKDIAGKRKPMLHGEIGPHQVFVTWEGEAKVLGIGLSSVFALAIQHDTVPNCARPYFAPEVMEGKPMTPRSNAYSAALLLWALLSRQPLPKPGDRLKSLKKLRPDLPGAVTLRLDQTLTHSPRARMSCGLLAKTIARNLKDDDRNALSRMMELVRARISQDPLPLESMLPPRRFDESQRVMESIPPMEDDDPFEMPTSPFYEVPKHLQNMKLPASSLPPPPQPDDDSELFEDDFGLSAIDAIMRPVASTRKAQTQAKSAATDAAQAPPRTTKVQAKVRTPATAKPAQVSPAPAPVKTTAPARPAPARPAPKPAPTKSAPGRPPPRKAQPPPPPTGSGPGTEPLDDAFKKGTQLSAGMEDNEVTRVAPRPRIGKRGPTPRSERIESTSITIAKRPPPNRQAKPDPDEHTRLSPGQAPRRHAETLQSGAVGHEESEPEGTPVVVAPVAHGLPPKVQIQLNKEPPAQDHAAQDQAGKAHTSKPQPSHLGEHDNSAEEADNAAADHAPMSTGSERTSKAGPPPPIRIEEAAPASSPQPANVQPGAPTAATNEPAKPLVNPLFPPTHYPQPTLPQPAQPQPQSVFPAAPGMVPQAPHSLPPSSYGVATQGYGPAHSLNPNAMVHSMASPHSVGMMPHSMGVPGSVGVPGSIGVPPSMMHPGMAQPAQPPTGWVPTRWVAITAVTAVIFFVIGILVTLGGQQIGADDQQAKAAPAAADNPAPKAATPAPAPEPTAAAKAKEPAPTASAAPSASASAADDQAAEDAKLNPSALPPNSGYLIVETPYYPDGQVYWNGRHRGKVGEPMVVLCGAGFLRIGNVPLTRWYSDGQPVGVECQGVSRVKIDQWSPAKKVQGRSGGTRKRRPKRQFLPNGL